VDLVVQVLMVVQVEMEINLQLVHLKETMVVMVIIVHN
jgi:hypothetical protein